MRLRLVGGLVGSTALRCLVQVAETYGDGKVRVTSRANLQLRALPGTGRNLEPSVLDALRGTGLLPSATHELVRNILVSPQSGLAGGRADFREVSAALDSRVCASPELSGLSGRFLFVLDDGRGDVIGRPSDLAAVALSPREAQLRVGQGWGPVVAVGDVAGELARLAVEFVRRRGPGPAAPWHVRELGEPLVGEQPRHLDVPYPVKALPYGPVLGGHHQPVPETGMGRADVERLTNGVPHVVVTPWRGVLVPQKGVGGAAA